MDTNLKEILKKQYESLPENVKAAIQTANISSKIQAIAKKHSLLLDQAGDLEMEVTLVLFGLEPVGDFSNNLRRSLGIPSLIAEKIAADVSADIFSSIRESLQELAARGEEDELSPESVLSEIENPTPVGEYAKTEPKVEAIIDARNELPAPPNTTESAPIAAPRPRSTPINLIDKKLNEPTSTYKVDPYREPLN